ncbi:MAG: SdrD B-like domain-containing protein [Thermoproteota archaeon]
MNGVWDEGEPGVEGIKIELWLGSSKIEEKTTGSDGSYCFDELNAETYTIVEVLPNSWMNTTSTSITVELKSGEISEGNNFGNVCLMPGYGGKTLGYWANAGNKLITSDDVNYLNDLNLYKPSGWTYPPFATNNGLLTARSQIRNYLLSANARDMRWMLSAQLIATVLNVRHGYLSSSTIVYVGPSTYVPSGFITIEEIISNANTALSNGYRAEQEYWKNILDWLNNNKLYFVCPEPCKPSYQ